MVSLKEQTEQFERDGKMGTVEATRYAENFFDNAFGPHSHQCYWNDRLAAALKYNLDGTRKRRALKQVLNNGISGYFERTTHCGLDLISLLKGVVKEEDLIEDPTRAPYVKLSPRAQGALSVMIQNCK